VLRDRIFVQTGETYQVKFKSSVAGALHPGPPKGPELEQVNVCELRIWDTRCFAAAAKRHLPLTELETARFY
jgi:hypothetical protein